MKAITITIEEDLDARAVQEANRRGISKSELIREGLTRVLPDEAVDAKTDPWTQLAGFGPAGLTSKPDEIDDVVYKA
jgi:Ribbon-helix-helix protein, copG family.